MKNGIIRYNLIDAIRGLTIISMILFHACWDLVYFGMISPDFMKALPAVIWQKSICCTFIFISGFVFCLGKRHVKHALVTLGCGILITLVTCIFMPDARDIFGVLWLLGISTFIGMLIKPCLEKSKVFCVIVFVLCFVLFILFQDLVRGYIGVGGTPLIYLPSFLYRNYGTALLGFPFRGFYSSDYFPVLPWSLLYVCGLCSYLIFFETDSGESGFGTKKEGTVKLLTKDIPFLSFIGRHSLLIYMLHQPLIFGLVYLLYSISH